MVILGIILYLVGAVIFCIHVNGSYVGLVGTLLVSIGTATMIISSDTSSPSAIDVYRGKTTLKITSVDGIPTDSVVVYKKK
jgi:hypothetical protein